ncbi:MAG: AraC family transcriptional regulator [Planctomycetes bacterium]|nr:AraC family transcriptional regulator [Planctomycetota bacterium]
MPMDAPETDRTLAAPWSGVELCDARMAPGLVLSTHAHERAHVCLVLEGAFLERTRAERECLPGTLRFSPAGREHELEFGPRGARCLLLELDPRLFGRVCCGAPDEDLFRLRPELQGLVLRLHELGTAAPGASALDIETIVLELLARAADDEPGAPPPWLREARAHIEALGGARGSVASIARRAGVHRAHLARSYARAYGRAPRAHIAALRVRRALELCLSSAAPLCEVALATGFCDQSHMTRVLVRRLGLGPGALRRQHGRAREASLD